MNIIFNLFKRAPVLHLPDLDDLEDEEVTGVYTRKPSHGTLQEIVARTWQVAWCRP